MEFAAALRRRRMVRRFTGAPLPEEALSRIAKAGLRAPSAGNARGIRLVVATEASLRSDIAECAGESLWVGRGKHQWLSTAPGHIVLFVDPGAYERRYDEPDKASSTARSPTDGWLIPWWWVDAGASLMAILLAAVDEGVAAGFLGGHAFRDLGGLLGVPDSFELVGVVTVGHPDPADTPGASALRDIVEIHDLLRYGRWEDR